MSRLISPIWNSTPHIVRINNLNKFSSDCGEEKKFYRIYKLFEKCDIHYRDNIIIHVLISTISNIIKSSIRMNNFNCKHTIELFYLISSLDIFVSSYY